MFLLFSWLDVLHGSTALLNAVTAFQKKGTLNRDTMKRVSEETLFIFYFILNESSSLAGKDIQKSKYSILYLTNQQKGMLCNPWKKSVKGASYSLAYHI